MSYKRKIPPGGMEKCFLSTLSAGCVDSKMINVKMRCFYEPKTIEIEKKAGESGFGGVRNPVRERAGAERGGDAVTRGRP
jgi:hypothetical protein